jgi:hypothetical protein
MKREAIWKKGMAAACVLGFAALLTLAGFSRVVKGQEGASPVNDTDVALTKHALVTTYLEANANRVNAVCNTSGCSATSPVFTPSVVCPGAVGTSCTYQIHLDGQVAATMNDIGFFQFLVDGAVPNPGPTENNGFIQFAFNPNAENGEARSYGVTAMVKNTSANQAHAISVSIGCADETGDGCVGTSQLANLQIGVYHP